MLQGTGFPYFLPSSKVRTTGKLHKRQTHAAHRELIRTNADSRRVSDAAAGCDVIVLIDSVAADSDCANQFTVLVKRNAARKNLYSIRQVGQRRARQRCSAQVGLEI